MTNSIFTIQPYWLGNTWVFDAPSVHLVSEPFVSGTDAILTKLVQSTLGLEPKAGVSFQLIFSANGFPDYQAKFERQEPQYNGYWYTNKNGDRGWLCPATLLFFPNGHPPELYIKVLACST